MTYAPWGYQKPCLRKLERHRQQGHKRALVVMAPGLGKTVVSALDIKKFLQGKIKPILHLCHQSEILEKSQITYRDILGEGFRYGFLHGKRKNLKANVLFATFQTMHNYLDHFVPQHFSYVVVDESHHSHAETYLPVVQHFQPEFMLAITATPDREDLLDIREIFGREIVNLPLERALARGYLTPVDYRVMTDIIVDESLQDIPAGRISLKQLNRDIFLPRRDEEIARLIQEKMLEVAKPKVIVFCRNIQYCEAITHLLPGAKAYHSRSVRAKDIYEDFKEAEAGIIVTVDKFNEGIDIPDVNMIVFLRSTASTRIFKQQLGRGLRRVKGKKSVLVLDFVGNIKRLEMIEHLRQRIQFEREKVETTTRIRSSEALTISTGVFQFDEEVINVLDLIHRARTGYTKEALIVNLTQLAEILGRRPTWDDVRESSIRGTGPDPNTYIDHFGRFSLALGAAGFSVTLSKLPMFKSENDMLLDLRKLTEMLGHLPSVDELTEASDRGECVSETTYARRFGSLGKALQKCGYRMSNLRLDEDELLAELTRFCVELGHIPTKEEINQGHKQGKCASPTVYFERFGGISNAVTRLGLKLPKLKTIRGYSDDDLIANLLIVSSEVKRIPTISDIRQSSKHATGPGISAYIRAFGSWNNALKAAGLIKGGEEEK